MRTRETIALGGLTGYQGLVSTVAEKLREAIAEGKLQPGDRLIQEDIARDLGISREPIRQAIRLLEIEGLILDRPRRGAVVAPLNREVVRQLYDLRAAVDGMAARRAAERPPAGLHEAPTIISRARGLLATQDVHQLIETDRAFHLLILEASGNQLCFELMRVQWQRIGIVARAALQISSAKTSWDEHQQILDSIVRGDADQAERLARMHAWGAADRLEQLLARNGVDSVVQRID